MKKKVLAALLSGVMFATSAATAFATDGEEIFLGEEDEIVVDLEEETDETSEEADPVEEVIIEDAEEETDNNLQEGAFEEVPADTAEDGEETQPHTTHATGHRSACKLNITNHGGSDDEAFFNEEYPAKYITAALPPLRNQGNYGTCWAHATMGLLEINMMKSGLMPDPDFSELHLAHFYYDSVIDPLGGTEGDYFISNDPLGALNIGGNGIVGLDLLSSWCGAASEELLPYSYASQVGTYGIQDSLAYEDVAHVRNYYLAELNRERFLTFKNPAYLNPLKKMVMDYGAATISFGATDGYSATVSGSVYNYETGAYYNPYVESINHEVVVVGWDDNFPKENFGITPPHDGAFLVRNSWADEGDIDHPDYSGYFWMSYYERTLGDEIYGAEVTTADNYDNNYQYDGFLFSGMNVVHKGANVFTAHAKDAVNGENLKAVSVFLLDENCNYTVEVYRDLKDLNDPESGTREVTVKGTSTFAGRYTVPLNKSIFLKPGETFAVVVTSAYDAVAFDISTGCDMEYYGGAIYNISAKEGQSFFYENGEWNAMADNLKIKAYTDNVEGAKSEAKGIRLDNAGEDPVNLGAEETFKINYTVYPLSAAKTPVTITSSNPEVASVSGSTVTGHAEGSATITLTTENGKTASFDVVVVKKVKNIMITYDTPYYENGVKKVQCHYVLDPEDYVPESVVWVSSDENIFSVDQDGIATYNGFGEATISVIIDGARGNDTFYSGISDDQVYFEVTDNNTVYIKWVPVEGADGYTVYRGYEILDSLEGTRTDFQVVDTYYAMNPVNEVTEVTYEIWYEFGFTIVPYVIYATLYPVGEKPSEPAIEDWGDIWQEEILEQLGYDLTNIPDGVWYYVEGQVYTESADLESVGYEYTGKEVTLKDGVTVFYKNKLLIEGRDYSLSYKNNINASTERPCVKVSGKGKYKASATFTFDIVEADIETADLTSNYVISVDKKKKTRLGSIRPKASFKGKPLKEGVDFTYRYIEEGEDGPFEIENPSKVILSDEGKNYQIYMVATENGNFFGEISASYISVYDFSQLISASSFKVGDSKGKALKVTYEEAQSEEFITELFDNTEGKTPKGYVFYKGKELEYNKDYQVITEGEDCRSVGKHTVYICGQGDYAGTKDFTFEVTGIDISKAEVAGLLTKVQYTGYELALGDLFDAKDKTLEEGWETVTLYTGGKSDKTVLAEDDGFGIGDYFVTFKGAKNPGKYTLTFTGINRCSGELKKTITITPYDIKKNSENSFKVNVRPTKYTRAGVKPQVEVTFGGAGEFILTEGSDYVITYKNNKKVSDGMGKNAPTLAVKGIGNFTGIVKDINFRIFKGNSHDFKLEAGDIRYNKKGRDRYFLAKYMITEGGCKVSVGPGKEMEIDYENSYYEYVNDAEMEDGGIREAGTPVDPTDRPKPGTEIQITIWYQCGENSPYFSDGFQILSTTYKITQ